MVSLEYLDIYDSSVPMTLSPLVTPRVSKCPNHLVMSSGPSHYIVQTWEAGTYPGANPWSHINPNYSLFNRKLNIKVIVTRSGG